ncbi:hypothetical protein Q5H93_13850 [Hymenobacter sp. ASUV-10]|uniref:Uncharacterized protein n=1 Tax=Hymenobacter aranciens TaxID=3063996 RepID=A0ABT9BCA3_9BACT|nr:hypothetical protein [Hymenobacter sp. ASUV-10]MDO7875822.1 hypothetical protein [Hymenobacter sp. ASUV-10]
MKRLLSLFLAMLMFVGGLVPQHDLAELAKLPQLVQHYRFHKTPAAGGLTLLQFLAEHYGAGTRHYAGTGINSRHKQDHHDLPLRCHHGCAAVAFVLPTAQPVLPVAAARPVFHGRSYGWEREARYAFRPLLALLQPPRA